MIKKVPLVDKDGNQIEEKKGVANFFVNQFSLKLAHEKFSRATGMKIADSAMLGPIYFLGEEDGIKIRTLADDDENKLNMQKSIYTYADVEASLSWWKEAERVLGTKLTEVDAEKVAQNLLTVDDFIFDDITMKESDELRNKIETVNKYIISYQESKDEEKKKTCLAVIKVLLPEQYAKQERLNLNYRQIAELAKYGKNKDSVEWNQFMEFARGLDHFNEIIATKEEQQKTKTELKQEAEAEALIKKIEERKQKAQIKKEKRDELRYKIAVWEVKALLKLAFAADSVKTAVKKGAKKIYDGSKAVATKVKEAFASKEKTQSKDEMSM